MDTFDNINHVNITPEQRAQTLIEALPYIQRYYGKTIVIKYGGNAMVSEELRKAVIDDIVMLSLIGVRVIVVHGGGPEISGMLKKIGKESRFVNGLRYTDEETMDVVQSVLCGKVNKDLVKLINDAGGKAVGLSGMDDNMIQAVKLDKGDGCDYGLVGEIEDIDPEVIFHNGYGRKQVLQHQRGHGRGTHRHRLSRFQTHPAHGHHRCPQRQGRRIHAHRADHPRRHPGTQGVRRPAGRHDPEGGML